MSKSKELLSLLEFTPKGHNCDKCGAKLSDDDYARPGSWNYKCPECGFKYVHGSTDLSNLDSDEEPDSLEEVNKAKAKSLANKLNNEIADFFQLEPLFKVLKKYVQEVLPNSTNANETICEEYLVELLRGCLEKHLASSIEEMMYNADMHSETRSSISSTDPTKR